MKTDTIKLSDIRIDGGTQLRKEINETTVIEYADAMKRGASFPPLTVFHDGKYYWLADGFHRYHGARTNGAEAIRCEVRQGTRRDAILHAAGSNAEHGLPRTNADKREAVLALLNDKEWSKWSDREIARRCAVSHDTVNRLRKSSLSESDSEPSPRTYTTKHGTTAVMDTSNIGRKSDPEPASITGLVNTEARTYSDEPAPEPEAEEPTGEGESKKAKPGAEVFGPKARKEANTLIGRLIRILDKTPFWPKAKPHTDAITDIIDGKVAP